MAEKEKKKTTKKKNVQKNSTKEISHTIKKLQENEKKYTIILVICFIVLFIGIGYNSLKINTIKEPFTTIKKIEKPNANVSISYPIITLTNDKRLALEEGLNSNPYNIHLENETGEEIPFKIYFIEDSILKRRCDCHKEIIDMTKIHYSLDKVEVKSITSSRDLVIEGVLQPEECRNIPIQLWIDKDSKIDHFHGKFILEV